MLRSALLVLSGNAVVAVLMLARSLIVARLVPVADYGISATFALAMALIDMISAFGLTQQIVQAREGDDPRFQAALQGFQVLRGAVSTLLLLALSWPIAAFLRVPEVAWAYQVMALVPLVNALAHFDIQRLSRQLRFGPMVLTRTLPAVLSLAAVWPLALWFGDFRVMLGALLVQATTTVVTSHLVAERRYRLVIDPAIMMQSMRFGWPLLLNGVLLFAVFHGDKLIVGRELGIEALAIFSMGLTLTLQPTMVLARSLQNLFLPQLSRQRDDPVTFGRSMALLVELLAFVAVAFAAGVMLVGGPLAHLLLGDKYLALMPILTAMAVVQSVRVLKAGPSLVALALGESGNAMRANLVRLVSLPLAWWAALAWGEVMPVILIALAGETLGLLRSLQLMGRSLAGTLPAGSGAAVPALAPGGTLGLHLAALALLAAVLAHALVFQRVPAATLPPVWLAALTLAALAVFLWTLPELRRQIRRRLVRPSR